MRNIIYIYKIIIISGMEILSYFEIFVLLVSLLQCYAPLFFTKGLIYLKQNYT